LLRLRLLLLLSFIRRGLGLGHEELHHAKYYEYGQQGQKHALV
jgi:hypothetical protein